VHKDFIVARRSPRTDPDGTVLERVLRAQLDLERVQAVHALVVYVLAGAGLPLCLVVAFPRYWSTQFRDLSVFVWEICAAAWVAAIAFEWRRRRERAALLAMLDAATKSEARS
jgi:hypothetical protein